MRLKSRLISVAIVSSLALLSVANTAAAADPMIDQRAALSKIDQDYKAKTKALRAERSRAIKAAGDKAAADASAAELLHIHLRLFWCPSERCVQRRQPVGKVAGPDPPTAKP
jgi:hypothetical protein